MMRLLISQALAAFTRLLYKRTILILVLLLCAGVVGAWWNMSRLSINLIESQALQNATLYAQAINEARTLYSSEAVNRSGATGQYAQRNLLSVRSPESAAWFGKN
jgi:adenylate cyclase